MNEADITVLVRFERADEPSSLMRQEDRACSRAAPDERAVFRNGGVWYLIQGCVCGFCKRRGRSQGTRKTKWGSLRHDQHYAVVVGFSQELLVDHEPAG